MSHPYRTAAAPAESVEAAGRDPEALAVYALLALLGAARLVAAVALGETFGAECTVAIAMVVAAAWGVLAQRRA